MNKIIIIFILGIIILIGAIIINILATKIGLKTWYDILKNTKDNVNLVSKIFLYIIYPFLLGLIAYYSIKLFNK